MKCLRCQHENPTAQKFCGECGAHLIAVCPSCRQENPAGQKFCGECGTVLATAASRNPASPEQYTPKHLAERILSSRGAMEGERKQVTVLFADLKGSMELLADSDPEDARALLEPVIEHMMEAVHHYEGTVNQVMGDGIMALFGAPLAQEDHGVRACYAALRMQDAVRRYAEQLFASHGVPVEIRVGLNSGEVVVGGIGSDLRMEYTAVGQTTHLAARMEQMALPGTALMTAATLALAEGYVSVKARGRVPVKGLAEPIELFELAGAGAARTRLQAATARGLTKFVGRDAEFDQLNRALDRAGEGHGQIVAVVGEPGVGKSRLFHEFTHSHRLRGWSVLESGSVSYGKATSYLPVIALLKSYFRIEDRDDVRIIREKLTGKLLTLDPALGPALDALLALLDVPVEDSAWQALDPLQRRQRILDASKRLMLRESQVQPLVLVFEDLHWIDSETQALLDSLVESLPTARLVLLVTFRPDYQSRWGSKTYYTQLRIDPLSSESAEELLRTLLGADASLQPLAHLLIERTQGNPLYIEESVRTLVESGALGGERGNYHLLRLLSTIDMPATVQAILAARIDRLSSEDKRLLQTASVIGKDVPFALLQAVGDPSEDQVRARISHLQSAEFLYELHLFPDLEYTFKHALTHEVTYASLLSERRKLLHRRSLEAIEQVYADRLVEHIDRLAHHAYRAEAWDQAVTYSRVAAERALRRLATREALAAVEQALSALPHLPQTRENLEQAVDIRLLARIPLTQLNEQRRMHAVMSETEMLARRLGDPLRLGWALTAICHSAANTGRTEEALEYGAEATALAHQVGNAGLGIASNFFYGLAFMFAGRYPEALQLLGQCRLAGERIEPEHASTATPSAITLYGPYLRTLADAYAAWCLMERGEFEEAVNRAECAVSSSEAMGMAYATCLAQAFFGAVHLRRGSFDRAIALLEVSVDAARRSTSPFAQMLCSSRLGYAYAMVNRVAEGISMLEAARDLGDSSGERTWTPLTYSYLGEAYSLDGNYREAAACTFRGVELARGAKQRGCEAWGLHALAGVLTQCNQGDTCEPEQHYRSALALAEELRMRPLIAHCRLGLGELEKRMGQPLAAREDVKIAAAMFREMGMHRWIERTELVRAHI